MDRKREIMNRHTQDTPQAEETLSAISSDEITDIPPESQEASDTQFIAVDADNGLSAAEVQERIAQGKQNTNQNIKTKSVATILRENFISFFNFVFVVLAVILFAVVDFKNDFIGAVGNFGFMILVIFNSLIGVFQELRAKRTIDKLSILSAPKVTVIRDGRESEIAVNDIVLDDVTVLSSGSQICADAMIVEGTIEVNESLVTGESDPILKKPGDKVLSGSFVVAGQAKAQVIHVGIDNFAAKISAGAKYFKKPNSEIRRSLMLVVKFMAMVIIPLGIALFCVKYYVHHADPTVNETIITTIGTVVGMIPSGLVALSSTVFCVSVIRLSKYKTLAQDLYCVETLARVDTLCLDKTGTITEGTMDVKQLQPISERNEEDFKQIIKNVMCALPDDNATANAMRNFVSDVTANAEAQNVIPFSSARKWSGARIDGVSYVIGAPEFVIKPLPEDIKQTTNEMAQKGFRVMILASSANDFDGSELPSELVMETFIFITDKIREEAFDTLRFFKEEGVDVKIISGDNPDTVRAVAMRAGLESCDNIIDMSTLKTEEEVYSAATQYSIFGRVLPDQKLMLVKALKASGRTVAMTGDGVNDVLALKEADCSVAMASGSDAAKNVSSLVLLDSNFASMPKVVAEGRRSINNLERSAALYIMKTIYNTLLAILFLMVKDPLPFEPKNLTLMGAVTIGIPSVILALEPNKDRVTGHFLPKVLSNAIPGGLTVLLCAAAVIICNTYILTGLTDGQQSTMFIITITFVGFLVLARVSVPPTVINSLTFILMISIFIMCFAIPWQTDLITDFFGINTHFSPKMLEAIASICAVMLPIYIGMVLLVRQINKKHGGYWDEKFEKLDARMRSRAK